MIGFSVAVADFLVGLLWAAATVGGVVGGVVLAGVGALAFGAGYARRAWRRRRQ